MTTLLLEKTAADLGLRAAAAAVIGRAKAAMSGVLARRKARYDARRALGCDDRFLRDVGVCRGDLRRAIGE